MVTIHLCVAGVSDLIAAEGKYHPHCYNKFLRNVSRSRNEAKYDSEAEMRVVVAY